MPDDERDNDSATSPTTDNGNEISVEASADAVALAHKDLFGDDDDESDAGGNDSGDAAAQGKSLFGDKDSDEDSDQGAAVAMDEDEDASKMMTQQRVDLDIELPEMPALKRPGDQIIVARLPAFLNTEPRAFSPEDYVEHVAPSMAVEKRTRLRVENTVRWRHADAVTANHSNTRLVKWSDGSWSLQVGSEMFEVTQKPLGDEYQFVFADRQPAHAVFECQGKLDAAMAFRPYGTMSSVHKRLRATNAAQKQQQKQQKTKFIGTLENPERAKAEMEKLEAEKERLAKRRLAAEEGAASGRGRRGRRGGSGFGFDDDDDDLFNDFGTQFRYTRPGGGSGGVTAEEGDDYRRQRDQEDEYDQDFVVADDEEIEMASEDDVDQLDEEAERERDQRIMAAKKGQSGAEVVRPAADGDDEQSSKRRRMVVDSDDEDE